MHLRGIADARGCYLVDLWSMRFLRSPAAWSPDRLHLTAQSHQRIALRACEVLGVPVTEDWRAPLAADPPRCTGGAVARAAWLAARREDARWAREYLAPWVSRRLHGTSSGDGRVRQAAGPGGGRPAGRHVTTGPGGGWPVTLGPR